MNRTEPVNRELGTGNGHSTLSTRAVKKVNMNKEREYTCLKERVEIGLV
jgi:hypothetical protein